MMLQYLIAIYILLEKFPCLVLGILFPKVRPILAVVGDFTRTITIYFFPSTLWLKFLKVNWRLPKKRIYEFFIVF